MCASCFRVIKRHWGIPLLVADSFHTNAHLIASVRSANYIAAIKDNQLTLNHFAQEQLADTAAFRVSSLPMAGPRAAQSSDPRLPGRRKHCSSRRDVLCREDKCRPHRGAIAHQSKVLEH